MQLTCLLSIVQQLVGIVAVEMVFKWEKMALRLAVSGIEVVRKAGACHGGTLLNKQAFKYSKFPMLV
jgi:hypothetical protein